MPMYIPWLHIMLKLESIFALTQLFQVPFEAEDDRMISGQAWEGEHRARLLEKLKEMKPTLQDRFPYMDWQSLDKPAKHEYTFEKIS